MGFLSMIRKRSPSLFLLVSLALLFSSSAHAAALIELDKRLTWDLVGLDSNNELSGPDTFPVGYRYCNSGDTAATNVTGTFSWDSTNSYINLEPDISATIELDELGAGACYDFYFNIQIARDDNARGTSRKYHIAVTADGLSSVNTPSYNQIFIESLVSQNRNQTTSIDGPTTVFVGETYQYVLHGSTATNGYEQLETYINFTNNIFRIISVDATYSAPPGANDAVYADACGWVHDSTDPDYNSCTIAEKIGGDIVFTYEVEIIGTGSVTMSAMIYDQSGSSYHYNADYGDTIITVTALSVPEQTLTIDKSITAGNSYGAVGDIIEYEYIVTNTGNIALPGPVTVDDNKVTVSCPPVSTLNPGESITCTASYSVVQEDLDICSVTNVAYALVAGIASPSDLETATCGLSMNKIITAGNSYGEVGDTIDYSYLVTNIGNIPLPGPVTVNDNKTTVSCPPVSTVGNFDHNLGPGESITCTADYSVVQADIDSCSVINVARASVAGITSASDLETATCKKFFWPMFMPAIFPPPCPAEPLYCYTVSDRDNETSTNSALLKYTFKENKLELLGRLGVGNVETMTLSLDATVLYAVDSDRFGIIDTTPENRSSFSPVSPHGIGWGNGALGKVVFADIDGIAFDPSTGILYGTNRLVSSDLLLQINPGTGTVVKNAFGQGVDYVLIGSNAAAASRFDLDDIAIDNNGTMYGIANGDGYDDRLVIIDKKTGNIADPVLLTVDGVPLNDVEGFSYYSNNRFYGTTGIETVGGQGKLKNTLFQIEMNPVRVEKIINLDQDFNGYRPYDFEALACRMCVPGD